MTITEPKIILVACNGNIHRSVIAEHCINQVLKKNRIEKEFVVVSRGLQGTMGTAPPTGKNLKDYPVEWSISYPILQELGIDISDAQSTPVDSSIVEKALLILAMDRCVLIDRFNSLIKRFPEHGYKMRLFRELEGKVEDVPDCGGSVDPELHRKVIELIYSVSTERFDTLLSYAKLFQKGN